MGHGPHTPYPELWARSRVQGAMAVGISPTVGLAGPLRLLREAPTLPGAPVLGDEERPVREGEERLIRCAACGLGLAQVTARVQIGGRHAHVFANPAGLVFEIGCFRGVFGARGEGPFMAEFSWFPGHSWQVAICRSCEAHLGWRFSSLEGFRFWGLILSRLAEY